MCLSSGMLSVETQPAVATAALIEWIARLRPRLTQAVGLLTAAPVGWAFDYPALGCCVAVAAGTVPWLSTETELACVLDRR